MTMTTLARLAVRSRPLPSGPFVAALEAECDRLILPWESTRQESEKTRCRAAREAWRDAGRGAMTALASL